MTTTTQSTTGPTSTGPTSTGLTSARASLRRAAEASPLPGGVAVADLWSPDDEAWRAGLERSADQWVLLSSLGVQHPDTGYLTVLAAREQEARRQRPDATVVRLAPVIEDLAVYAPSIRSGESIFHAYGDEPVGWLSAADVLAFVHQVVDHPQAAGGTFDLAGPERVAAVDLLAHWIDLTAGPSGLSRVPAEVLQQQLTTALGTEVAGAIVGHQAWAGSPHADSRAGTETLQRAIGSPVAWQQAVRHLTEPSEEALR